MFLIGSWKSDAILFRSLLLIRDLFINPSFKNCLPIQDNSKNLYLVFFKAEIIRKKSFDLKYLVGINLKMNFKNFIFEIKLVA